MNRTQLSANKLCRNSGGPMGQFLAHDLRPLDKSVQLLSSNVTLEHNQAAVGGETKLIGGDKLQDLADVIRHFLGGFGDGALYIDHTRPELEMLRQGVLLENIAQTAQVAPPSTYFQIEHVHFRFISLWQHIGAVSGRRPSTPGEVEDFAGLSRLVGHIGRCAAPVAPADVTDNLRALDSLYRAVKCLNGPVLVAIGPGKLVKLDEVGSQRVHFEDILIDGLRNIHSAVPARLVVEVVGGLPENLDAGILYLDGLISRFFQRPGLLDHDLPAPLDFLRGGGGMEATVDGEAEIAAMYFIAHAPVVVIDGLFSIVIALQACVGNNIQPGFFLIVRKGKDRVFQRFALKRIGG